MIGDVFYLQHIKITLLEISGGVYVFQKPNGRLLKLRKDVFTEHLETGFIRKETEEMKTQVIIIGEKPEEKKEISFMYKLLSDLTFVKTNNTPSQFKHVEVVTFNYLSSKKDLFFAYDDNRMSGFFFIGNYNDGVV